MSDEIKEAEQDTKTGVNVLFRHKTIRRFRIGRFEFKNNELRLQSQRDLDDFLALIDDPNLPKVETLDIVQVNEEAAAAVESTVIRGAMGSKDILTQKSSSLETPTPTNPTEAGGINPALLAGALKRT